MRSNLGLVTFRTDYAFEPGQSPREDIAGVEDFLAAMEMFSTLKRYQAKHGRSVPESQVVAPPAPAATEPKQGELF